MGFLGFRGIDTGGYLGEPPAPGGEIPVTNGFPLPPSDVNIPGGVIPTPNGGLCVGGKDSDSDKHSSTSATNPLAPTALPALCRLYDTPPRLMELRGRVLKHRRPERLVVTLLTIGFTIVQLILFGVIVLALPVIDDIQFIWICEGSSIFIWWVGGAAMISGIFRTFIVSSFVAKDEVFHLSMLPCDIPLVRCEGCSVAVELPPARTPGVRLRNIFTCTFSAISALPRYYRIKLSYQIATLELISNNIYRFLKPDRGSVERFSWASKCMKLVYRRSILPHPMVVVLRLIPKDPFPVRHPFCSVFLGLLRAMMFIFLSFLFGSIWGGTLFYTLGFVAALMGTIFVSRFCSIFLCRWLERSLEMTVIQCETVTEMAKIKKALATMSGVLVESKTDFYKYSAGYRLDRKCQNHSQTTIDKETPSFGVLGLIIGFIVGVIEGTAIGLIAYIVLRLTDQRFSGGPVFSGGYLPPLVIGLSLGICFSILLFVKIGSEFGALSGYAIEVKASPGTGGGQTV